MNFRLQLKKIIRCLILFSLSMTKSSVDQQQQNTIEDMKEEILTHFHAAVSETQRNLEQVEDLYSLSEKLICIV